MANATIVAKDVASGSWALNAVSKEIICPLRDATCVGGEAVADQAAPCAVHSGGYLCSAVTDHKHYIDWVSRDIESCSADGNVVLAALLSSLTLFFVLYYSCWRVVRASQVPKERPKAKIPNKESVRPLLLVCREMIFGGLQVCTRSSSCWKTKANTIALHADRGTSCDPEEKDPDGNEQRGDLRCASDIDIEGAQQTSAKIESISSRLFRDTMFARVFLHRASDVVGTGTGKDTDATAINGRRPLEAKKLRFVGAWTSIEFLAEVHLLIMNMQVVILSASLHYVYV